MKHRELGGTGLTVSRMGIGLAALGRPAYVNIGHADDLTGDYDVDAMCRRTAKVLDAAWDAGVTYVDDARSYGRAEAFLASWLHGRASAERPVIGSKWGYSYTGGWRLDAETHEVKDHSRAMFERQLAETDALLGPALDLYQVHSLTSTAGRSTTPTCSTRWLGSATRAPWSARASQVRARPMRSGGSWRSNAAASACSRPSRRRGMCWSPRRAPCCGPPTTRASA